jgi:hypothetical protein
MHKCNGKFISKSLSHAHERADLRQRTSAAQARFQSSRFIPSAQPDAGPVSRTFPVPLHPPPPPLSPYVEFHNPPRTSDSAVEQQMLDNGFLTGEDLDIMTFGSDLPNLGPNFQSPEALIAAMDHFMAYNNACTAGARSLTSRDAHHLATDPEERALQRQIEKLTDEVRQGQSDDFEADPEAGADEYDLDLEVPDDDNNIEDIALEIPTHDEDHPDPFMVEDNFNAEDRDLSGVPVHTLTIYALVLAPLAVPPSASSLQRYACNLELHPRCHLSQDPPPICHLTIQQPCSRCRQTNMLASCLPSMSKCLPPRRFAPYTRYLHDVQHPSFSI